MIVDDQLMIIFFVLLGRTQVRTQKLLMPLRQLLRAALLGLPS